MFCILEIPDAGLAGKDGTRQDFAQEPLRNGIIPPHPNPLPRRGEGDQGRDFSEAPPVMNEVHPIRQQGGAGWGGGGGGVVVKSRECGSAIGCYEIRYVIRKFATTSLRTLTRDDKSRLAVFFARS